MSASPSRSIMRRALPAMALLAAGLSLSLALLWGAPAPFWRKPPKEITNSIGMRLALVPAGTFLMGSPEGEENRHDIEGPRREVEISRPFYLGKFEVTQAQYRKVMGENPSFFSSVGRYKESVKGLDTDSFPVEAVSWHEARAFCAKLSALPEERAAGRSYRLPTEAEWEYACRAGTSTPYHFGDTLTHKQANIQVHDGRTVVSLQRPTVVGSYLPNAFGLHDMHGNVEEWCQDRITRDYYKVAPKRDPAGPAATELGEDEARVARGGSYIVWDFGCRSASRGGGTPNQRSDRIGFRVVCVLHASGR